MKTSQQLKETIDSLRAQIERMEEEITALYPLYWEAKITEDLKNIEKRFPYEKLDINMSDITAGK